MSTAEQIVLEVITGGRPVIRNLRPADVIPPEFEVGFERLGKLDYDWIWVIERYGVIDGCIVAAPCHGIAFVYRVAMRKDVPKTLLRKLIYGALKDAKARGVVGMMTFLDPSVPVQLKLKKLLVSWGGNVSVPHEVVGSRLPGRN